MGVLAYQLWRQLVAYLAVTHGCSDRMDNLSRERQCAKRDLDVGTAQLTQARGCQAARMSMSIVMKGHSCRPVLPISIHHTDLTPQGRRMSQSARRTYGAGRRGGAQRAGSPYPAVGVASGREALGGPVKSVGGPEQLCPERQHDFARDQAGRASAAQEGPDYPRCLHRILF